jgi:hypothetical protein
MGTELTYGLQEKLVMMFIPDGTDDRKWFEKKESDITVHSDVLRWEGSGIF